MIGVTLTEEEKKKIYEEEKIRAEARVKAEEEIEFRGKQEEKVPWWKPKGAGAWGCLTLFIILGLLGVFTDNESNKDATKSTEPSITNHVTTEDTQEDVQTVIDFKEFMEKEASYFIQNLGIPVEGEYYAEPPMYTNWSWEYESYEVYISFPKGAPIQYLDAQFKDGVCDQESGKYLKMVGLEYPQRAPDVKRDGIMYRWEPYSQEYERLNVYCNDIGTRVVLISETAE